jgi:putative CocE/NonD family hydrolase
MARQHQRLLMTPQSHTIANSAFPEHDFSPRATLDFGSVQIRWFDYWLKGIDNGVEQDKPVRIFVMGEDRWREEDDWPLPDTRYLPYYLRSGGHANSAAGDGLLSTEPPGDGAEDVYLYDPRNPVPTVGGPTLMADLTNTGPRDQHAVESRDDVLCYTTEPLEEPVEVTGPIELVVYISSSARDTDFTGKLVDVYPDGRAEILSDGILRSRYRESFSLPVLMEPGNIYELHIDLMATSNVFKEGHRIRLDISSSNFPRFDRNTNTGGTIATESEKDFVQAVNRVYHDSTYPSHLVLPIIERD